MLTFEEPARAAMRCIDTAQGALLTLADGTTLRRSGTRFAGVIRRARPRAGRQSPEQNCS